MRLAARVLIGLLAAALLAVGVAGAYSYAQSYSQHRGFVRLAKLANAGNGRLLHVNFYSRALHRNAFYLVYLPPGYAPTRRYPVYYLLHGMPGRPQAYIDIGNMDVRLDNLLSLDRVRPMILVFPDGRIGGSTYSDSEWANTPSGNYDGVVIDVVNDVDHRFSTLPYRQDRVIGGLSAGAYGAINVALHHLGYFGSLQVWSGYFIETRTGVFAHASRSLLDYNSPLDYVRRLHGRFRTDPMSVFLFVGRGDPSARQIVPMARALKAAGARVRYAIYPGGHDWGVWYPRLDGLLGMASHDFSHPLRVQRLGRATGHQHRQVRINPILTLNPAPVRHHVHTARFGEPAPTITRRRAPALAARPAQAPASLAGARPPARHRDLLAGLLLAILSAALINLGFLLQHRGLRTVTGSGSRSLLQAARNRTWLGGQLIGWVGLGAQIVAVGIAPLSLVQAFAVGGLALSVPLAAGIFHHRVSRAQALVVLLIALALATLPIALGASHDRTHPAALVSSVVVASLVGIALGAGRRAWLRAAAAGVLYGVADAAIKADAVGWHLHGASTLLSGWTIVAVLATFGGFVAFQAALRSGDAVSAISIMTALCALIALAFGVAGFGESLGRTPAIVALHLLAILLVIACVPVLARAQHEIAEGDGSRLAAAESPPRSASRPVLQGVARVLTFVAASLGAAFALLLSVVAGFGLLYVLRQRHWLWIGTPVHDALPLLALPGFDSQALVRMAAAWIPAGMIVGLVLIRIRPLWRTPLVLAVTGVVLIVASDAAFALTRNLRVADVLWHRSPTAAALLEASMFAIGAALPRRLPRLRRSLVTSPLATPAPVPTPPSGG